MNQIAITGASSSIGQAVISAISEELAHVTGYSRQILNSNHTHVEYIHLDNYNSIKFPHSLNKLLVCNGSFSFGPSVSFQQTHISEIIQASFEIPSIIINEFLKATNPEIRRDIFVLGSTAAHDLGAGTAFYSSAKAGLRALLASLNNEYRDSETKFSFVSYGTVNNQMGALVPGQIYETLINQGELAIEIFNRIFRDENYFEPEIVIRRRRMQAH